MRFSKIALHPTPGVLYAADVQTNGDKYATRRLGHRYTVPEAAEALGVTVDAIRSRVKRHTIMHVREGGRVYVLLSGDQGVISHDQGDDQGTAHHADQPPQTGPDHRDELLEELRNRVRALEEANRENRRLLAAALERIPPQLEPPRDEPGASETVAEASEGTDAPEEPTEPQRTAQEPEGPPRRSWWRRWFVIE